MCQLAALEELAVGSNRLTALTGVGAVATLRLLNADNNLLSSLPAELGLCTALEHLNLENNRLTAPVIDLR